MSPPQPAPLSRHLETRKRGQNRGGKWRRNRRRAFRHNGERAAHGETQNTWLADFNCLARATEAGQGTPTFGHVAGTWENRNVHADCSLFALLCEVSEPTPCRGEPRPATATAIPSFHLCAASNQQVLQSSHRQGVCLLENVSPKQYWPTTSPPRTAQRLFSQLSVPAPRRRIATNLTGEVKTDPGQRSCFSSSYEVRLPPAKSYYPSTKYE